MGLALIGYLGMGTAQATTSQTPHAVAPTKVSLADTLRSAAKIVPASKPLQCVPYARKISGVEIYGDAWTWWKSAEGRFARGRSPEVGAVLVMKKTRRLRLGHVAVVKQIVNSRTIIVDQANWLNRGRIHLNTAVLDVSPKNDWSAVRVWYTPGGRYGARTYPAHGFIYAGSPQVRQANLHTMPLPRRRPADLVLAGLSRAESEEPASHGQGGADGRDIGAQSKPDEVTARTAEPAISREDLFAIDTRGQ